MTRLTALFAAVLLAFASPAAFAETASPDDNARILAGMEPSAQSPLAALTKEAAWKAHASYFDASWKRLEAQQLSKVRVWSDKNLPKRHPVLFYMFSGPDFLYADAFFHGASTYVMAGLEPVGQIPDLTTLQAKAVGQELRELQGSLNSVLNYSFFITKRMRTELNTGRLTGTTPVLYTFIARSGKTVKSASLVSLKADGTLGEGGAQAEKDASQGVKIEFTEGADGKLQTLYYFSTDISDKGLKTSGMLKFMEGFGTGDAFVKSASYLMHADSFSTIRSFLIAHAGTLVQDDSGIPVRFIDEKTWDIRTFGHYLTPLGIFPGTNQPKLRDLFAKGKAEPLDFGVGYRWRPSDTNLMLATKRVQEQAQAPN